MPKGSLFTAQIEVVIGNKGRGKAGGYNGGKRCGGGTCFRRGNEGCRSGGSRCDGGGCRIGGGFNIEELLLLAIGREAEEAFIAVNPLTTLSIRQHTTYASHLGGREPAGHGDALNIGNSRTAHTALIREEPDGLIQHADGVNEGISPLFTLHGNAGKRLGQRIEKADMMAIGDAPNAPQAVGLHMVDAAVREARRTTPLQLVVLKADAIKAIESVPGGQPEDTFAILSHAHYGILREAVIETVMGEQTGRILCLQAAPNA